MNGERVRSFVAFTIPAETRTAIGDLSRAMREKPGAEGLRFVRPEILHLTVRFFGDLDRKQLEKARQAVHNLHRAWAPPAISIGSIGAFPNPRRPQVLWVGVDDPAEELAELAAVTDRAIRLVGFGPPDKPFVGHMTLARVARGRHVPDVAALTAGLTPPQGPLKIESITLFRSDLRGAEGPLYTPIEVAHPRADEGQGQG
jgi:RNA 2',3'-cyclic 3'-phosphodiesterase